MDYKKQFSERLVLLREKNNLSQQELADNIGITRQSLSLYEKAERTINIELLAKIADIFNVTTDYLMGRSETASMNEDIQAACKVTGFSEATLLFLKETEDILSEAANKKGLMDTADTLIRSIHPLFIGRVYDYIETIKRISAIEEFALSEVNRIFNLNVTDSDYFEVYSNLTFSEIRGTTPNESDVHKLYAFRLYHDTVKEMKEQLKLDSEYKEFLLMKEFQGRFSPDNFDIPKEELEVKEQKDRELCLKYIESQKDSVISEEEEYLKNGKHNPESE